MNKEEIIRRHFHGFSDEQWNELKNQFPYSEIPFIIDHILKEQKLTDEEKQEVEGLLMESTWISRWSENKQSLHAVLEPEESMQIVKDIFEELDKAGYKIIKKI